MMTGGRGEGVREDGPYLPDPSCLPQRRLSCLWLDDTCGRGSEIVSRYVESDEHIVYVTKSCNSRTRQSTSQRLHRRKRTAPAREAKCRRDTRG